MNGQLSVGNVQVEHHEGEGFSVVRLGAGMLDPAEALALAEWLRSKAHDEIQVRRTLQYRAERQLKREEKKTESYGTVKRFWYSFYTETEQPRKPFPFPVFKGGAPADGVRDAIVLCVLVDAVTPPHLLVGEHWPDAQERFCAEKTSDWTPPPHMQRLEVGDGA